MKRNLITSGFTAVPPGATSQELTAQQPPQQVQPAKQVSAEDRVAAIRKSVVGNKEKLADSLRVESPRHEGENLAIGHDLEHSMVILPVMEIMLYDRNPRKSRNPKYSDIKESIRNSGILHPPVVTKRPGQDKYMIYGGGNTRLLCMQELYLETKDPKFERMACFYRLWKHDTKALAAHLVENEQRADISFMDKVEGYADLRLSYELDFGPISNRRFEELLRGDGLPAAKTTLHIYGFTYNHLRVLGEASQSLSKNGVRDIVMPRLSLANRLIQRYGVSESDYWELVNRTLDEYASSLAQPGLLEHEAMCIACEGAVAAKIGLSKNELAIALQLVQQYPDLTPAEIARHLKNPTPIADGSTVKPVQLERDPTANKRSAPQHSTEANVVAPTQKHSKRALDTLPPSSSGKSPSMREILTAFGEKSGIADLLVIDDALPGGFYINPPSKPLSAGGHFGDGPTSQYAYWWMLAILSGQLRPDFHLLLPATSEWRQLQESEDEGEFSATIDSLLGGAPPLSSIGDFMTAGYIPLELLLAIRNRPRPSVTDRFLPLLGRAVLNKVENQQPIDELPDVSPEQRQALSELGYALDGSQWIYSGPLDDNQ